MLYHPFRLKRRVFDSTGGDWRSRLGLDFDADYWFNSSAATGLGSRVLISSRWPALGVVPAFNIYPPILSDSLAGGVSI